MKLVEDKGDRVHLRLDPEALGSRRRMSALRRRLREAQAGAADTP